MGTIFITFSFLFLIFAIFLQIYLRIHYLPKANQIAKLVLEKKYKEAIVLGESIKNPNTAEKLNLVGAYYANGNLQKARKLAVTLKPTPIFFPQLKREINNWKKKLNI